MRKRPRTMKTSSGANMDLRSLLVFVFLWTSVLSGDVRLVGGASRCAGRLQERYHGDWRPMEDQNYDWNLTTAAEVCRRLDCGSVVSLRRIQGSTANSHTISDFSFMDFLDPPEPSDHDVEITCSDSLRLVNGTDLCSGRLEVKSDQSWSSVCEDGFDLQDMEVVCRELGCGAPSVLQGALYGDIEAPMCTEEFHCGGHESSLLYCRSSVRKSSGCLRAAGLTCSEPVGVRLVGGSNRCNGDLEMKQLGEWKPVGDLDWKLRFAGKVCGPLDCGSPLSTRKKRDGFITRHTWGISSDCEASSLVNCFTGPVKSIDSIEITCSDSLRLVNGTDLCSGRLEVKSNRSWFSVCEDGFDRQDAEVVCKELGCGSPSVLQGALYGDAEAPVWTEEFQCGGNESSLLDCDTSPARNNCSPGRAVGLTCVDQVTVRLVGKANRCVGTLEMKHQGKWRPVVDWGFEWDQNYADLVCLQLGCGSAVSTEMTDTSNDRPVWWVNSSCLQSISALPSCLILTHVLETYNSLKVICSEVLFQPIISLSPSTDGVSEAEQQEFQAPAGSNLAINCSVRPQYPGGSFQLTFNTRDTERIHTLPAVNHTALFLFPSADSTHQGNYTCVYQLHIFSHNFSSASRPLHLTITVPLTEVIRLIVVLLGLMLLIAAPCCVSKVGSSKVKTPSSNSQEKLEFSKTGTRSTKTPGFPERV